MRCLAVAGALAAVVGGACAAESSLLAKHLTATVDAGGLVEIALPGFDKLGRKRWARITALPEAGSLFQLSQVYSDYGYEPKQGPELTSLTSLPVTVSGSGNRILYAPPAGANPPEGQWARFQYVVTDGKETSEPGIVWLLPLHGRMVGSDFSLGTDGWAIVRNGAKEAAMPSGGIRWEAYSRGDLSFFVSGSDGQILVDGEGQDRSRWEFTAPQQFLGNQAAAYGGSLEFTIGSSAGDFSPANRLSTDDRVVTLSCASCDVGRGVRLAYFADSLLPFDGITKRVSIRLDPSQWKQDPRNTVSEWGPTFACQLVEVLSGLTAIDVLGDHTRSFESVALDNVALRPGSGVPVECAAVYY